DIVLGIQFSLQPTVGTTTLQNVSSSSQLLAQGKEKIKSQLPNVSSVGKEINRKHRPIDVDNVNSRKNARAVKSKISDVKNHHDMRLIHKRQNPFHDEEDSGDQKSNINMETSRKKMKLQGQILNDQEHLTSQTIVLTPVDGKSLRSTTSVLKLFGDDKKAMSTKVKAHTFSQTLRTLYVHFNNQQVDKNALDCIAERFNQMHPPHDQKTMTKKKEMFKIKEKENNKMLCIQSGVHKRYEVEDPETDIYVIMKNVSPNESDNEIMEALQEIEYKVDKV
ncbi:hypothetical protein RFI_07911, partial [Reticulomyxa filosa]